MTDCLNKYIDFCHNYPNNFIEECWAGYEIIISHLKNKFNSLYDKYGSRGVMNQFYAELDLENRKKLADYIFNLNAN